jgi:HEAT repeat protein
MDSDVSIRCDAAEALVRIEAQTGVDLVIPLLSDFDSSVRWHTCGLLHDFGDERAVKPLIKVLLEDSEGDVRLAAAYALEKIGDATALPALQWAQQYDQGADYEGRLVSEVAAEAIRGILARQ